MVASVSKATPTKGRRSRKIGYSYEDYVKTEVDSAHMVPSSARSLFSYLQAICAVELKEGDQHPSGQSYPAGVGMGPVQRS